MVGPDLHFEKVTVLYLEKTWEFHEIKRTAHLGLGKQSLGGVSCSVMSWHMARLGLQHRQWE